MCIYIYGTLPRPTSKAYLHQIALHYKRFCLLCTYAYIHLRILVHLTIFGYTREHVLCLLANSSIETGIEKLNFNAASPVEPRTKMSRTLDSWILFPLAGVHDGIELKFNVSMQVSVQPDFWNQEPRFKNSWASWFLVPGARAH